MSNRATRNLAILFVILFMVVLFWLGTANAGKGGHGCGNGVGHGQGHGGGHGNGHGDGPGIGPPGNGGGNGGNGNGGSGNGGAGNAGASAAGSVGSVGVGGGDSDGNPGPMIWEYYCGQEIFINGKQQANILCDN